MPNSPKCLDYQVFPWQRLIITIKIINTRVHKDFRAHYLKKIFEQKIGQNEPYSNQKSV